MWRHGHRVLAAVPVRVRPRDRRRPRRHRRAGARVRLGRVRRVRAVPRRTRADLPRSDLGARRLRRAHRARPRPRCTRSRTAFRATAAAMAEPLAAAVHAVARGSDAADVGVLGGGPMGLMLAALLSAQGRSSRSPTRTRSAARRRRARRHAPPRPSPARARVRGRRPPRGLARRDRGRRTRARSWCSSAAVRAAPRSACRPARSTTRSSSSAARSTTRPMRSTARSRCSPATGPVADAARTDDLARAASGRARRRLRGPGVSGWWTRGDPGPPVLEVLDDPPRVADRLAVDHQHRHAPLPGERLDLGPARAALRDARPPRTRSRRARAPGRPCRTDTASSSAWCSGRASPRSRVDEHRSAAELPAPAPAERDRRRAPPSRRRGRTPRPPPRSAPPAGGGGSGRRQSVSSVTSARSLSSELPSSWRFCSIEARIWSGVRTGAGISFRSRSSTTTVSRIRFASSIAIVGVGGAPDLSLRPGEQERRDRQQQRARRTRSGTPPRCSRRPGRGSR